MEKTKKQIALEKSIARLEKELSLLTINVESAINLKCAQDTYNLRKDMLECELRGKKKELEKTKAFSLKKQTREQDKKAKIPQVLIDFQNQLETEVTENWLKHFRFLKSKPYPHFSEQTPLAKQIRSAYHSSEDEIIKDAKKYVENLVFNLFKRVCDKVGNITKVDLHINKGNLYEGNALNGTVTGDSGYVSVKSILASGEVQRLHVRVLVK